MPSRKYRSKCPKCLQVYYISHSSPGPLFFSASIPALENPFPPDSLGDSRQRRSDLCASAGRSIWNYTGCLTRLCASDPDSDYTNYDKHLSIIGHGAAINAESRSPLTIGQMKVQGNCSGWFVAKCMVSNGLFLRPSRCLYLLGRQTKSLRRLSTIVLAKKIYKNNRKLQLNSVPNSCFPHHLLYFSICVFAYEYTYISKQASSENWKLEENKAQTQPENALKCVRGIHCKWKKWKLRPSRNKLWQQRKNWFEQPTRLAKPRNKLG